MKMWSEINIHDNNDNDNDNNNINKNNNYILGMALVSLK